MTFAEAVETAQHLATIVAIGLGGGWAVYQYLIKRAGETGLLIEVQAAITPWSELLRHVFVDVTLKNTGQRRLDASLASEEQLASQHEGSVHYAASLQVRRVVGTASRAVHIDWWASGYDLLSDLVVPEVCLLTEYLNEIGEAGFFMEPGEEYHIGTALLLERGTYLGKIVFVGSRGRAEYWSRIFAFAVN